MAKEVSVAYGMQEAELEVGRTEREIERQSANRGTGTV